MRSDYPRPVLHRVATRCGTASTTSPWTTGRVMLGALLLLVMGPAPLWGASGDPAKGKERFGACQACHGERGQGNEEAGAPQLARQHDWYLILQLQNFKAGLRGTHKDDRYGQLMAAIAKTLPDEQAVLDVVAYIGTLTAEQLAAAPGAGPSDKGRIAFAPCRSCHGERGEGSEGFGPRLAGQHDWYLLRQLRNFRAGRRGYHEEDTYGQTMRSMANALLPNEQDLNDVVSFIGTLR